MKRRSGTTKIVVLSLDVSLTHTCFWMPFWWQLASILPSKNYLNHALGPPWGGFGVPWGRHGASWRRLGSQSDPPRAPGRGSEAHLAAQGGLLGRPWGPPEGSEAEEEGLEGPQGPDDPRLPVGLGMKILI